MKCAFTGLVPAAFRAAAVAAVLLLLAACGAPGSPGAGKGLRISGPGSVGVGETISLSASGAQGAAISWSSSNEATATVDASGSVKGISAGSVTIAATATDNQALRATHAVTVTAGPAAEPPAGGAACTRDSQVIDIPDDRVELGISMAIGMFFPDGITCADMKKLLSLSVISDKAIDLAGLQHATNVREVTVRGSGIVTGLSSLQELPHITSLTIKHGGIKDITFLSGLVTLEELDLRENLIGNLTPLQGLVSLRKADLSENIIKDISVFEHLTTREDRRELERVDVRNNCLDFSDGSAASSVAALLKERGVSVEGTYDSGQRQPASSYCS